HPKTRNYIYEWIFQKALKKEGILSLRYDFIEVTLNGKDLGVYAIEEFFDKRLIEHNEFREGPIIRFDETIMWDELIQRGDVVNSGTYMSSPIDAFQTAAIAGDSFKQEQFLKAMSLLESFRRGESEAADVFDVKKMAAFFAITDLFGSQHAAIWINMRFYFNPITARLEPIGFDGNSGMSIDTVVLRSDETYAVNRSGRYIESFYRAFLDDREFYEEYIKELERVSDPSYLESFFSEIGGELEEKLSILYKEFPYYNFSKDVFYGNQHIINVTLQPVKITNAYLNSVDHNSAELDIGNIQAMDAEVLGVSCEDKEIFKPLENIILPAKSETRPVEYKKIKFVFPDNFEWKGDLKAGLKVICRVMGTKKERYESVFPFPYIDRSYVDGDFTRTRPNAGEFDFITVDEAAKKIFIKQGEWSLSSDIVFPQGFTVVCPEGTKIDLLNKASILSFSPLNFMGTEEKPVLIHSSDSTGGGFFVMAGGRRSILKHVTFMNLAAPARKGWALTGAVTFYESPADIYNCEFLKNRLSDDGLNMVRSEFTMDRTLFRDTFSDAFDCDFAKGKITNTSFINCGNDGLDISGTVITVKNILVDGSNDKGISAGEISMITAENVEVRNGNIGIASKDLSVFNIEGLSLSNCKIGFAVYMKKSEYGSAKIVSGPVISKGVDKMYVVEKGSSLTVEGDVISPNEKNVYKLLYGNE
ncbi:MAG: CotH kinase family protein, partial [Candidatus Omnitrophica bacterium]|nr:CotH kinase family protein [Candidatus Omnitrophota bacterium]